MIHELKVIEKFRSRQAVLDIANGTYVKVSAQDSGCLNDRFTRSNPCTEDPLMCEQDVKNDHRISEKG